ncbi:MAG: M48 family metalloprotease [Desulfobulbus sp.]|nr:M48 family metalloprotease [Desulfobulbus sp.]
MSICKSAQPLINRRQLLKLLGLGTGALTVGQLLSSCAVNPVTGRQQLMMMSENEEIAIDRQRAPYQFSEDYGVLQDSAVNSYIARVGRELAMRSHRPQMPFSFRGVNAAYLNAYAFPGGSIAVTRGMLVELESEAELAALLGHEIGHVCARHSAQQASKGMIANLLMAGATVATSVAGYGGASDLVQQLGGLGAGALLASYSRDNEREADALGMEYMVRAGYSADGMVKLMEVLNRNKQRNPSAIELMFATHPMSNERLATARQAVATTYQASRGGVIQRERYMDNTAGLRRIKPAVLALQNGSTAMGKKQYQAAKEQFAAALQTAPQDYTALVMMASCQMALKDTAGAVQYARRATGVYPTEPRGHSLLAISLINGKKYDQALRSLGEYDRLLPGNPQVIFYKGYCYEHMNRQQDAASHYHSFLQKVRSGEQAKYAYSRLQSWGYIR